MAKYKAPINTQDTFLGLYPYGPQGFVSEADEQAQRYKQINPRMTTSHWAYNLCFQDKGDESYGGSSYAYIPTNFQIISALEMVNRNAATEAPYHQNEPSMNSLLQSMYSGVSQLWSNIRKSTGTEQW